MAKKSTKAQLIKRREEIRDLILAGVKKDDIVNQMSEKWQTSRRAIFDDIRLIAKTWEEAEPEKAKTSKNKYLERLEMLLQKAIAAESLKVALEIQKEINKISGLYTEKEENQEEAPKIIRVSKKPKLKAVDGN